MVIVVKNITVNLDVKDPISFCANKDQNIIERLKKTFEKHCYAGCYILEIQKVVNISNCVLINLTAGQVRVTFTAKCLLYQKGDYLIGYRLAAAGEVKTVLGQENLSIMVAQKEPLWSSMTPEQFVPMRVAAVVYGVFAPKISIQAEYFTFNDSPNYIYVDTALVSSGSTNPGIFDEYTQISAAAEALSSSKAWDFFARVLRPDKYDAPKSAAVLPLDRGIFNLKLPAGKYALYVDEHAPPTSFSFKYVSVDNDANIIKNKIFVDLVSGLDMLLAAAVAHLKLHIDMINTYGDTKITQAHMNLWRILNKLKKPQ